MPLLILSALPFLEAVIKEVEIPQLNRPEN
jgi:hypothetical protein